LLLHEDAADESLLQELEPELDALSSPKNEEKKPPPDPELSPESALSELSANSAPPSPAPACVPSAAISSLGPVCRGILSSTKTPPPDGSTATADAPAHAAGDALASAPVYRGVPPGLTTCT
jgi:hypothetical protein